MRVLKNGYSKDAGHSHSKHGSSGVRSVVSPEIPRGFQFSPLTEGSTAQRIAVETLLNSIACDGTMTAFRNRSGVEMLPLLNVIVHLLCTHFANQLINPVPS